MKSEFKTSRRINEASVSGNKLNMADVKQEIRRQMARDCVEKVMEEMEFVEEQDAMTRDLIITGRVHIMSHSEAAGKEMFKGVAELASHFDPEKLHKHLLDPAQSFGLGEILPSPRGIRHMEREGRETNLEAAWHGVTYCLTPIGERIMSEKFWESGDRFDGETREIDNYPIVHVLVDGDIVAYRCAATCDGRYYEVGGERFGYSKDAKNYADRKGIPNPEITQGFEPEPVDAALHNIAVTLDNIKNYFIYERKLNPQMKVFLSGSTNFRYDVYPDYKANRKNQRRPHWLKECKEYIAEQFKGHQFEGYEADDLIGMTVAALLEQKGGEVFIASNDKDFTQLCCDGVYLYDFTTNKEWNITSFEALQYFYKQILMGDNSDNIPGLHRVGNQTALKILDGCNTERDMYNAVVMAYKKKEEISTEEAVEAVALRGKLLWLMREQGKLWEAPPPRKE